MPESVGLHFCTDRTPFVVDVMEAGGLSPVNLGLVHNGLNPSSPLIGNQLQSKISPLPSDVTSYSAASAGSAAPPSEFEGSEERRSIVDSKTRKNREGKARKRSQHTKGNKLWEFIRDALKDPITCPSIVRWEDPIEGVFRIVESEKLARLWGERKNNTKMTYEKLSRAMRTYYEKQILVPVPKTGLYPKKLVYKFGPGAHGWDNIKEELL
uniref:ETS domain-containing protein n=1 Tax=Angiostrongylus cantonensis TaxID=6313 RepID=A0A0K0DNX3_ANGCA